MNVENPKSIATDVNDGVASTLELSYRYFNRLLSKALEELTDLLKSELTNDGTLKFEERSEAVRVASNLYLKYIKLTNQFIKCHKYLANPQKREYMREFTDACVGRILELKHELVSLEMSDFHFFDKLLLSMKMCPQDMDLEIPEHFKGDMSSTQENEDSMSANDQNSIENNTVSEKENLAKIPEHFNDDISTEPREEKKVTEDISSDKEVVGAKQKLGETQEQLNNVTSTNQKEGNAITSDIERDVTNQNAVREDEKLVDNPELFNEDTLTNERNGRDFVEPLLRAKERDSVNQNAVTEKEKLVRMGMVYIRLIQGHERTRKARNYFRECQKKYLSAKLANQKEYRQVLQISISKNEAAIRVQRAWRKYYSKKMLRSGYYDEKKFLKMIDFNDKTSDILNIIDEERMSVIKREEREYLKEKESIKQEILTFSLPRMIEELEERIRSYFHEFKEANEKFPTFPSEEEGGSTLLLQTPIQKADTLDAKTKLESNNKKSKDDEKKKNKSKKTKTGKSDKDKKEDGPTGFHLKRSHFLSVLQSLLEDYRGVWDGKELLLYDKFNREVMFESAKREVEEMVRIYVDDKMRNELTQLTESIRKRSKKKSKKGKKSKKAKKTKKGEKKKNKADKDLTPDRSIESLVEELITQGIIADYGKHYLTEFVGDYNDSGAVKSDDIGSLPCLADIRRVINEYCVLPMGSPKIHLAGTCVKSILVVGPRGSGKKLLILSVCTEIGAIMMDLSAENLEGKYLGADGVSMLFHLVSKVGRLLQPTVVFINDAENYFWKKKPKNARLKNPGRYKKELLKFITKLKDADRILVCGTSASPFDADIKALSKCYSKIICISKPCFKCRLHLWREFIRKAGGDMGDEVDLCVLSSISDGFVASHIQDSVKEVLTNRRISFQDKIPLCTSDFVDALAAHVPVYEEEHKEYKLWLNKLPLYKNRSALYKQAVENASEAEISDDDY